MSLSDVQEQHRAVEALRAALRSKTVHHAYLFGGPEGVGKELAARSFAQALWCTEAPTEGCGECVNCTRIAKRNHPDVTWVMPEDEQVARGLAGRSDFTGTPSRDLKVEQIRQLQERLAFRSLEGGKKIAIVCCAQAMNTQAQNAFLKTLEEPPSETVLILVASAVDKLLPTIRSRCSKVNFGALPEDFVARRVGEARKLDAATARLVAVMSGGSLSSALELDVDGLTARRELIERFEAASLKDARTILRFAERFAASREEADASLRVLTLWFRDLVRVKEGSEAIANADLLEVARARAAAVSDLALHRRHALAEEALGNIARNASPRLQMERLLLSLGEVR